ncbi:MAG: CBS domain-containing protein [Methanobrevibacter arboriphilus]|jgi:CBS domain-containing protein|uniref:CBS domain-containing protein n=3 Tax=Methanobrevibacter arboriphilus TaxID=39441 RepID=A0A843ADU7_METAZ|nr:CBS domain-containing protein [Methanobrevibacter arboriphilus]MBF4469597.1 CBS domain-containing protein [Methanobrevibacter arboriphilus]MCC7562344.1 CBS domain-containing protein [Methanobrevibacter arboriphilus]BBL61915.1 inosine-5-monophosphate dehydrogenase [Methanobrevibacter arboriphilus]GLI11027.1 inosine-5-monophosphate dehydrogenase [Methanobrevibacter arboriphilus]
MIEDLCAKDIMLKDVIVSSPTDLVAAAKLKMVRANIGGVPVVDGDELVGLITHRDVLLAGSEAMGLKVRDLMSKELSTVTKSVNIKEISRIMADTGYQRIPVVEDKKLLGLITQSCIIRAVADNIDKK